MTAHLSFTQPEFTDAQSSLAMAGAHLPIDPLAPTIFHQPWWLDIATKGRYGIAEAVDNNRVVGRLPYYVHNRFGITQNNLPPLTHFLGPATDEGGGTSNIRFLRRLTITEELLRQLPYAQEHYIKCHRSVGDVIAFQKAKFLTSVQFTHEIHPQSEDDVWNGMLPKRRNVIKNAQRKLTFCPLDDPGEFKRFSEENLRAHGLRSYYDMDICRKLIETSLAKGCGRILATRENGSLMTAVFCVWDETSYYFLVGTRRPDCCKGSMSLLVWEAIRDAIRLERIFDMDGLSNDESISFYSSFGALIAPRYIAVRAGKFMRLARTVQALCGKSNYYC